jgi:hypothetical protein
MSKEFDLGKVIGPKGDRPAHQWNGTRIQFEGPDGTWSNSVDLKGDKGDKGDRGDRGLPGGQATFSYNAATRVLTISNV